jgi:hypothetical protein
LDAWIHILLGDAPSGQEATIVAFADSKQS